MLTGIQGSSTLLLPKATLFLSFQRVQKMADIPTTTKLFSSLLNLFSQVINNSCTLSGISNRLKAHLVTFHNNLATEQLKNKWFIHSSIPQKRTFLITLPPPTKHIVLDEDAIPKNQPQNDFHSWWHIFSLSIKIYEDI